MPLCTETQQALLTGILKGGILSQKILCENQHTVSYEHVCILILVFYFNVKILIIYYCVQTLSLSSFFLSLSFATPV